MEHSLISIVLPTYNRAKTLEKAISSVIIQTYENWELWVIDDASSDNTNEVMSKFTDNRIHYVRVDENRGANYCRNEGIRRARGEYIAFLDSDNYWNKNKLEIQLVAIEQADENVAFVFCREVVNDGMSEYLIPKNTSFEKGIRNILLEKNVVDTSTVLLRKVVIENVGGFDELMPRLQDWEFFFRIINVHGYEAIYISECLNHNIIQEDSITKNKRKYVDAIFYFLSKYPDYFGDVKIIEEHIQRTIIVADGEEQYIFAKVYESYGTQSQVLQELWIDLMVKYQKQIRIYSLLYQWKLKDSQKEGVSIFSEKLEKETRVIAIYGLGRWGELLYYEMQHLPVKILYGIDKNVEEFHSLPIKKPTDELEEVDMIIVTVFQQYEIVKAELQNRYHGKIVSIEELIQYS